MPDAPTMETPEHNIDPRQFLQTLAGLDTDQKKYNYLRTVFIDPADVDEYVQDLDANEELDLTKRQITQLKSALEGFKVYLREYLKQSGERIGRFEQRDEENLDALKKHVAEPEVQEKLFKTRRRISKAMQFAQKPMGAKGKSLREVTLAGKTEVKMDELDSKYQEFIDALDLSDEDKEKFKEMMSPVNYKKAVETAKEMDPKCRIPAKSQIIDELMTYKVERLQDICEMMEQPTLLIVSDTSFDEKVSAMDGHKHYTSQNGRSQQNAYVYKGSDSPYNNAPKIKRVRVSIVDGVVRPEQLAGVSTRIGERREYLTQKFAAKKMRYIDKDEMATLFQQSLREAEQTGDNNKIVDNWESGSGTVTLLDPNSLTKSSGVACACFGSYSRQVSFNDLHPDNVSGYARGRASVQVLEL